jgi:hypothetical protein
VIRHILAGTVLFFCLYIGATAQPHAAGSLAALTYPLDGATGVDLTQPITWNAVPDAQAYYLYVGTTAGAKNLINSGEIHTLSYSGAGLPVGTTLYARLHTRIGGGWSYTDSQFTAAALPTSAAVFTYPADGATNADLTLPLQWTTIADAQAYFLYVGSAPGASDYVSSGEIHQTSYLARTIPIGQRVYARIYTKVSGLWRYTDISYTGTAPAARLTYPINGASNNDLVQPFQWLPVPGAQAYYLYVGTTPGTKNLVDSHEIHTTSYLASNIPAGQTVYARLHTMVDNVWHFTEISYSGASLSAKITSPADGAINANLLLPITWTTVPNAQAYYLYVGTTSGAKDIVNTGEIHRTYENAALPSGQTLYARLHTQVNNIWHYTEISFSGSSANVTLTYPASGATHVDLTQPMQWTSVPDAEAYYLYLGTTPGANDLVNTGEIHDTFYTVLKNVPVDQTLYARIYVKLLGGWRYTERTFTAAPLAATLTYPVKGAVDVDRARLATWAPLPNADAYYLYVGTTPGARDIIDSHSMADSSFPLDRLPIGQTVYARLHTRAGGRWRSVDSTFTAPGAAEFLYPLDGRTGVDLTQPFQWTAALGGQGYRLLVGTTPGASDLLDTGNLTTVSYTASGLPTAGVMYARILTNVGGIWVRHSDIAFSPDAPGIRSTILMPVDGANFNTSQPIQWVGLPLARGYRLRIGTAPGAGDLHDSGPIEVTQRFVPNLPTGMLLYGRVDTIIDGQALPTDFTFYVTGNTVSNVARLKSALWATNFARRMAFDDDRPLGGTGLLQLIGSRYTARGSDYAQTVLRLIAEVNAGLSARLLATAFAPTPADSHAAVELLDPASLRWIVLDPKFNLAARRSDGTWATANDISQATLASNWGAISYSFLGTINDAYVREYVLDYPLLFLNVYANGQPPAPGTAVSVLPYLQPVAMPVAGVRAPYVVQCAAGTTVVGVVVDGTLLQVACNSTDSLSSVIVASTIAAPLGGETAFQLHRVRRFVF